MELTLKRRHLLALAAVACGPAARADDYPSRPIKLVANFPAGGPLDVMARLMAAHMATSLRQAVAVENVTGAGGVIGAAAVARAQPDGYTLLLSIDAPFTMSAALNPKTAGVLEQFKPVLSVGTSGLAVAVHPSTGIRNLSELVAQGRRKEFTFATPGIGSPGHFAALMLAEATGVRVSSVHYRGSAPSVAALLSGEVQAGFVNTGALVPHVKSGNINVLAAAAQRSPSLPELPTIAELGYKPVDVNTMTVLLVPEKTPDAVVRVLAKAAADAISQPEFRERVKSFDIAVAPVEGPPARAALQRLRREYQRIVQATGMKPE